MMRALAGFVFASLALGAAEAEACSCVGSALSPSEILANGGVVLRGDAEIVSETSGETRIYRIRVNQALGADLPEEVLVRTPALSSMCGVRLPETDAIVFLGHAGRDDAVAEPYPISSCGQLVILYQRDDWVAIFDAIEAAE